MRQSLFGAAGFADAAALRDIFLRASPFPHLVVDNLISADLLRAVDSEFDELRNGAHLRHEGALQRKLGSRSEADLPASAQRYFDFVHSGPFLRLVSAATGIGDLIPDPALFGGGMHEVEPGGSFQIHTDFKRHPRTRLRSRLVMITYLNPDWEESYGGALELWRRDPACCEVSIQPEFGRTVIMAQSAHSLHGLPKPVATPDRRSRRSLTTYYYTSGSGEDDAEESGFELGTTKYLYHRGLSARQKWELLVRQTVPPAVMTAYSFLRRWLAARSLVPPARAC